MNIPVLDWSHALTCRETNQFNGGLYSTFIPKFCNFTFYSKNISSEVLSTPNKLKVSIFINDFVKGFYESVILQVSRKQLGDGVTLSNLSQNICLLK